MVDGTPGAVHALDEPAYQVVKQILADSAVQTTEHAEAILWSSPEGKRKQRLRILELVSEGLLFTP